MRIVGIPLAIAQHDATALGPKQFGVGYTAVLGV